VPVGWAQLQHPPSMAGGCRRGQGWLHPRPPGRLLPRQRDGTGGCQKVPEPHTLRLPGHVSARRVPLQMHTFRVRDKFPSWHPAAQVPARPGITTAFAAAPGEGRVLGVPGTAAGAAPSHTGGFPRKSQTPDFSHVPDSNNSSSTSSWEKQSVAWVNKNSQLNNG